MRKRTIKVTTQPTYILNSQGNKIFLRELREEPEEEASNIYDFVCLYFPYLFFGAGWLLFFISLIEVCR